MGLGPGEVAVDSSHPLRLAAVELSDLLYGMDAPNPGLVQPGWKHQRPALAGKAYGSRPTCELRGLLAK